MIISNSASNQRCFDTTAVSITSDSSLVSSGIDYSVISSRPSLIVPVNSTNTEMILDAMIMETDVYKCCKQF